MDDNPYINQRQNWGKDLLDRLGNLTNANGSIHIWEEYPSVGPDGVLLNPSHEGYMGVVRGEESKLLIWNGVEWEIVLDSPFSIKGDPAIVFAEKITDSVVEVLMLDSEEGDSLLFQHKIGVNSFTIKRLSSSGQILWSSTRGITDSGYLYASIYKNKEVVSATKGGPSSIYFTAILSLSSESSDNPTRILKTYSFNWNSGLFQWETTIASATGFYPAGIAANSSDLYVSICNWPSSICRLNRTTGALIASLALSTLAGALVFIDSNLNVVVIGLVNGSLASVICDPLLGGQISTTTISSNLNAGDLYLASLSLTCQHPTSKNLFYFFGFNSLSQVLSLYSYNSTNNATNLVASNSTGLALDPTKHSIWGISIGVDGKVRLYLASSSTIVLLVIDGTTLRVEDYFIPGGEGDISLPMIKAISSESSNLSVLKEKSSLVGKGLTKTKNLKYSISPTKRRVLSIETSSLTNQSANPLAIDATLSFDNVFVESASTKTLKSTEIIFPSSSVANPDNLAFPNGGISSDYIHLFSAAGQGMSSLGYTGAAKGYLISGLLFNMFLAGDEINSGIYTGNNPGAALLFDVWVGKMFLQVNPSQSMGTRAESFPSAVGMVVTPANNFGIGTEAPAYKLHVVGETFSTSFRNAGGVVTSDERIKMGVASLNGLDLWEVCQELRAISFLYRPDYFEEVEETYTDENGVETASKIKTSWPLTSDIQYGYLAHEIEDLFPELVVQDSPESLKFLNQAALFPIFQAAATAKIAELEARIDQDQVRLDQQQAMIESLSARLEALENAA